MSSGISSAGGSLPRLVGQRISVGRTRTKRVDLTVKELVKNHSFYCGVCGDETTGKPHGLLAMFKTESEMVGYKNHCLDCLLERLDKDFEGGYLDDYGEEEKEERSF